jgi:hypothetical protein
MSGPQGGEYEDDCLLRYGAGGSISETSANVCQTTRRSIPEGNRRQQKKKILIELADTQILCSVYVSRKSYGFRYNYTEGNCMQRHLIN